MRGKRRIEVQRDKFSGENIATIHLEPLLVRPNKQKEFKVYVLVSRSSKHDDHIFLFFRWKRNEIELFSFQGGNDQETIIDEKDLHNQREPLNRWVESNLAAVRIPLKALDWIRQNGGLDYTMIFSPVGKEDNSDEPFIHSSRLDESFTSAVKELLDYSG